MGSSHGHARVTSNRVFTIQDRFCCAHLSITTGLFSLKIVYLHAMVRDKFGRKMSKALGNVIDPLEVINGCSLADLFKRIDEGNLPVKEVCL